MSTKGTGSFIIRQGTNTRFTCGTDCSTAAGVALFQGANQVLDTLTAGTGITITGSGNSRTIAVSSAAGVTSIAGTAGEISASASFGPVTLSLPSAWTPALSSVLLSSSTGGTGLRMDALGSFLVYETVSGDDVFGYDLGTSRAGFSKHVHFGTAAPTYVFGAAAGTSPSGSAVDGSDEVFTVTFTTGTSPAANDVIFALTFSLTWSPAPKVVFSPNNAASSAALTTVFVDPVSTGSMSFSAGATPLAASTTYKYTFHVFGHY